MYSPKMKYLILIIILSIFAISLTFGEENISTLVKKIEPSVVLITTFDKDGTASSQGTGFFISDNGDVITNRHVMLGAHSADIKTYNGKVFAVYKVLAEDTAGDIIRLSSNQVDMIVHNMNKVKPLSINTSTPEVGEKVLVIGNPMGLEKTVSDGIISAVRNDPEYGKVIQITAPISPGSSGSPVINMNGEVIGISTFQYIKGQNLNFAIPAERITKLKLEKGIALDKWRSDTFSVWLKSTDGLFFTGLIYLWSEKYEEAIKYLKSAIEKDPNYADAYFEIGECQSELGQYYEAIENYKTAIRIKPDYFEAHGNLGAVYGKLSRYTEEIECYKQVIRIKPDDGKAHYALGVVNRLLGRYSEAIEYYKNAIRINPDDANAYNGLGDVYCCLGRYSEAIAFHKTAIRIKPDFADAHFFLGTTYLILGDKSSALDEYKILKKLDKELSNKLFNFIYN